MRVLLVAFLLTSFTFLPVKNNKANDSNFEICREILYTAYPNEMNPKEWRMCMAYET
tara:strand:+ start:63 stop:233 length:171 start_codon:yes stop_codon:yes gene_type:complete